MVINIFQILKYLLIVSHHMLNFILFVLDAIGNEWVEDKTVIRSVEAIHQVTNYFYTLGYSVERKSNDRKIHSKRFILSMHDGIIFYEYVASPRALDTSART